MHVFRKKIGILENREKFQWVLIRRTRILNCNPIRRWKRGEKSGETKTGENWGEQDTRFGCQICRFQTVTKCDPS